jgi:MFS family permease
MGIPIARWADRGNRVTIISLTAALWSVAVALCGMAGSFVQLLLIRIAVGVGEAGCKPPALSLISDHFSRAERPRAVARYELGWPLALTVGYFVAGWTNQLFGWRATFVALGLPGLALAALAGLTLKEPRRATADVVPDHDLSPASSTHQPSLKDVFATLWASASYRHLVLGMALTSFFTCGMLQWQPAFFMRSHGLGSGELGIWLAAVYGVAALPGTYLGGELASRYAPSNERLQLIAVAIGVLTAGVYLAPHYQVGFGLYALAVFGGGMGSGPIFAATQTLVPPRMRAMSVALVLFFSNLIGLGLGPLAVGALSDALRPLLGEESLRYALVAFCPGYLWAAWHLWRASRTVARDVAHMHLEVEALAMAPTQIAVAGSQ